MGQLKNDNLSSSFDVIYYHLFSCILKPILKGWKTFLVVINLMEELVELGFTSRQKLEIKMMADFLSYLNSSKHLSKAYTILFITKNWKFFHILIKSLCWDKRGKYRYILYADDIHSFLCFCFAYQKQIKCMPTSKFLSQLILPPLESSLWCC